MLFRYIFPTVLVAIAIILFFSYVQPTYHDVQAMRVEKARLDAALAKADEVSKAREDLSKRYGAITKENKDNLLKMLPNNVDNIPLILDIQGVAKKYGMIPQDIKYDVPRQTSQQNVAVQGQKEYGTFDLEFSVVSTYPNFTKFLNEIEQSLRIVDISSITFAYDKNAGAVQAYKFTLKVRTYWLKN